MDGKKKFHRPRANVVYVIDGASYGADEGLVEAMRASIGRRLESKTLEIPRLPQVAGRILELSRNPGTNIDKLIETIATDPLLVTRILTVANSAAYAGGDAVEGLQPALMRLGLKAVQEMVFAESIRLRIFSARAYRAILEQSWRLSLGTAVACEVLSRVTGLEREGAFLLGLLHDTGTPVVVNAVAEYERQNQGRSIGEAQVEILISALHEEIGAHVLESWGMPHAIVEAARAHHLYQGGKASAAHRLVHAGNLICQHLGIGGEQRDVDFTVTHVFADLRLADLESMAPILDAVARGVESMMAGLGDAAAEAAA